MIQKLVVDAGPVILGVSISGLANEFYVLPEFKSELKDKKALKNFTEFPFEWILTEPTEESITAVMQFAKETGDLASLSKTDLRVLALTWMLEKQANGVNHLRSKPVVTKVKTAKKILEIIPNLETEQVEIKSDENDDANDNSNDDENNNSNNDDGFTLVVRKKKEMKSKNNDFDGDWITPSNIKKKNSNEKDVAVACMTTDFAMQVDLF